MKMNLKSISNHCLLIALTLSLSGCSNEPLAETENVSMESETQTTEMDTVTETITELETTEETTEAITEEVETTYTYTDMSATMYAKSSVNVRDLPTTTGNILGTLNTATEVTVTGQCNETQWYRISYNDQIAYISNNYLSREKLTVSKTNDTSANTTNEESNNLDSLVSYHPADTNNDGVVDAEEENVYITPDKQACIDAGYGNVVSFNGGEYYMVLTHADGYVGGIDGMDILHNYLRALGLDGHCCCYANGNDDMAWYIATDIYEISTEEIWE